MSEFAPEVNTQQTSSLPISISRENFIGTEYMVILALTLLFMTGFIIKIKKRNALPKHPYRVYQEADRHAAKSLREGEVNEALNHYQKALSQVAPPKIAIEEDSSRRQVAWILHKKIEELHELEK